MNSRITDQSILKLRAIMEVSALCLFASFTARASSFPLSPTSSGSGELCGASSAIHVPAGSRLSKAIDCFDRLESLSGNQPERIQSWIQTQLQEIQSVERETTFPEFQAVASFFQ